MRWAALALAAGPVWADGTAAPDYFVAAAFASSTAQAVARSCPDLSVDPVVAARETEAVLARLEADGFTPETIATEMADPTQAIAALQDGFRARHDLADGAPPAAVCAAGRAEIAGGTDVGRMLIDLGGDG